MFLYNGKLTTSMQWTTSYLPSTTSEVIGRVKEVAQIKEFVLDHKKGKALLLYGPCGSGKTSVVTALAKELNYELLELNASDARNKEQLLSRLLPAVKQQSFFYSGKIILVDEIDGLSGQQDKGGATTLAEIIQESPMPMILTANDISAQKLKPVLKVCSTILFDKLSPADILTILKRIVQYEKITIDEKALRNIATRSDGDVRGAINDLQMLALNQNVTLEHVDMLTQRKRSQSIESALTTIYKSRDPLLSIAALDNIDDDLDEFTSWIDYNTAKEYTQPKDLVRAYSMIAKADVFKRRIMKNQEWRFLVHIRTLLSAGICLAKDVPYKTPANYQRSTRGLKIWQISITNAKRKVIASKIAQTTHCSTRVAFSQIDYYKAMFRNKDMATLIASQLDLDAEEISWLKK